MNKLHNLYLTFPVEKPLSCIAFSVIITLIIGIGSYWIKIDDDFVKMFPKNIKSKIIWDEIQSEFGSSEKLVIAFGNKKQSITDYNDAFVDDEEAYAKLTHLIIELNKLSDLIDYVLSINNFSYKDDNIDYNSFSDHSQNQRNNFMNQTESFVSVYISPKVGINNTSLVNEVKNVANNVLEGYDIHFAGQPYLTGETPTLISKDVRLLLLIGIVIMLFLLALNLRSIYSVFCVFISVILSLFSMVGFMGWMYFMTGYDIFNFTILSTSMPIILLTIANSDGVHVVARFRKEMRLRKDPKQSIVCALDKLRAPIFLTSLTTAIAFLAMIFSPIPHMIGYGIIISFGVIWAWILSTTLLPSLMLLKKWKLNSKTFTKESFLEKRLKLFSQKVVSKPKKILFISSLLLFISFIGIWYIKVEVNIIKFFKEDTSIRQSTNFIDNEMSGSMNLIIRAKGDFEDVSNIILLDSLEQRIHQMDNFSDLKKTLSYAGVLKESFKVFYDTLEYNPDIDDLDQFLTISSIANDDRVSSLINDNQDATIISGQIKTVSTQRASDISDRINMEIDKFKTDFDSDLNFEATGLLVFLKEFVGMVVESALTSILVSILIIFIITFIFFKRIYWAVLSIIPLLTAIILNFGIMGLIGVELSHLTALLTSVIIGVGVDFSIHYISEYRHKIKENISIDDRVLNTSQTVGYPIMLDVISNLGFVSLLFSSIIPLNYMGALMVFAMISTSFGALTILSSIIELCKNRLSV